MSTTLLIVMFFFVCLCWGCKDLEMIGRLTVEWIDKGIEDGDLDADNREKMVREMVLVMAFLSIISLGIIPKWMLKNMGML